MSPDEALALLDRLLPTALNNLQEIVFCQVWMEKTYAEIADEYNYEHSYIRDVGFKLWNTISEALGEKVSKSNVKAILNRYARTQGKFNSANDSQINTSGKSVALEIEFPNGAVPLNSLFYIKRSPIENKTFTEVLKPGSLIRLKGPRQIGKTSLLMRILHHAKSHNLKVFSLSFHRADRAVFDNLDQFLRWFCANISYQLGIPSKLDEYWNNDIGSKVSCTIYLEEYLLKTLQAPLVIALDEVDLLFRFPQISSEFFSLLRSWHEDAKEIKTWQSVRWILVHATDVYVPLKLSQSPFNVGLSLCLPEFSLQQVQELIKRHQLCELIGATEMKKLMSLLEIIGYRPGLVRLALYHLSQGYTDINRLTAEAHTQSGIYSDRLRQLLAAIHPDPDLKIALKKIVSTKTPVELSPLVAYRLESIGLIKLQGNSATIACELYRKFFAQCLEYC